MPGDISRKNGLLGGRPKNLEAIKLREELIRQIEANAKPLAKALIDKGLVGDVPALKELYDRGLGKVTDKLEVKQQIEILEMDV